jgi:ketosteroid isomerase-like protein
MRVGVPRALRICAHVSALGLVACASASPARQGAPLPPVADVRAELERRYQENADAFERGDLAAVMRLRAPDFHTFTPEGQRQDRIAMEQRTQGFMNGIRKWNSQTITIDSLRVVGDTAFAAVTQHLDRMALRPDNQIHQVETWVTQRETWVRHGGAWLLWRVDQVRNQRRLVDGQPDQPAVPPGDPSTVEVPGGLEQRPLHP